MEIALLVVLAIDAIMTIILNVVKKRQNDGIAKAYFALLKQNELLERRNELLETIFAKQYEEVKKKYASDRKEQP